jgi:phospholipid/cholesterol/gamma-HCH transport system substrate-binding protein
VRSVGLVGRLAAVGAVIAAIVIVAVLLFGSGGDTYTIKAHFINAGQLVKGNQVEISGTPVGSVDDIALTPDGQAVVTVSIKDDNAPLRSGTRAVIRQASLSGIANRYIDLQMPPGTVQATIPEGGTITERDTSSAVDLDQLFNLLRPRERRGLQRIIRGFGDQIDGRSRQAAAGFAYLDPNLATNARLFDELTRDRPALERFILDSSRLATHVAQRRDDLAGLVDQLANFTGALAHRRDSLGQAVDLLPPFLRRANTTFVNLRATLDDLDPVIDETRPVAKRLGPVLDQLRPFAREARPTVRDLAATITSKGADNDLIELTRSNVPLRDELVRAAERNGAQREGALPASVKAFKGQTPPTADFRPYTADLLGWFDDFGHTGVFDANGGAARSSLNGNAFTLVNGTLAPIPPDLRDQVFHSVANTRQTDRCPGAAEHAAADGSNPWKPSPDFPCDPSETLPGP